ncbi:MAG: GxxExxY protein [Planctomycetota bacterium]
MQFDELSNRVIGCALEVHTRLGPGLLESTYRRCLAHELRLAGIDFELEKPLPVAYRGSQLDCGYRLDLVVDKGLVLELKCVEHLLPIHEAQLLTYLKLSGIKVGLLINFNTTHLRDGIKRLVF